MTGPREVETWEERTALSWQRTGLGVLAVAGLLAHKAALRDRPLLLAVAGGVAILALAVLGGLAPARRRRVGRAVTAGRRVTATGSVLAATLVVVATAAAALVPVLETVLSSG